MIYKNQETSKTPNKKRLTAKQEEYLQLLQERNRLKKQMAEKSHESKINEERERGGLSKVKFYNIAGFSTHFAGANASAAERKTGRSTTPVMTTRAPAVTGIPISALHPQAADAPRREG